MVATVILIYALGCYPKVARSVPLNYVLLFFFTLAESYVVSTISSFYDAKTVFIAGALTAAVTIAITIYAFKTKTDFTMMGGLLFIMLAVLIVGSIISIFIRNRWLSLGLSIAGVIIFGIYLIYDT